MASNDDFLLPFQIDANALRGRLIRLGPAIDDILNRHAYPEPVAVLLGEALTLAGLLGGALKYDGVFTLQTKGDGPVRMMVADFTSAGHLRGYAQFDEARLADLPHSSDSALAPRLLGAGHMAFTVDQGADTERYQGIVALDGATLVDCAHHYFRQSEQLEAALRISVARSPGGDGAWRAAGMMVQRLPDTSPLTSDEDEDGWRRALALMGSATHAEMLDVGLDSHRLLFRLFHEDGVRVFSPQTLSATCRCSRQRVSNTLAGLARAALEEYKTDGVITVTCEFCNRAYAFDDNDLAALHKPASPSG